MQRTRRASVAAPSVGLTGRTVKQHVLDDWPRLVCPARSCECGHVLSDMLIIALRSCRGADGVKVTGSIATWRVVRRECEDLIGAITRAVCMREAKNCEKEAEE